MLGLRFWVDNVELHFDTATSCVDRRQLVVIAIQQAHARATAHEFVWLRMQEMGEVGLDGMMAMTTPNGDFDTINDWMNYGIRIVRTPTPGSRRPQRDRASSTQSRQFELTVV